MSSYDDDSLTQCHDLTDQVNPSKCSLTLQLRTDLLSSQVCKTFAEERNISEETQASE